MFCGTPFAARDEAPNSLSRNQRIFVCRRLSDRSLVSRRNLTNAPD
jgi:hypothetical protein